MSNLPFYASNDKDILEDWRNVYSITLIWDFAVVTFHTDAILES